MFPLPASTTIPSAPRHPHCPPFPELYFYAVLAKDHESLVCIHTWLVLHPRTWFALRYKNIFRDKFNCLHGFLHCFAFSELSFYTIASKDLVCLACVLAWFAVRPLKQFTLSLRRHIKRETKFLHFCFVLLN